jgi:hypothetical protein
MPPKPTNPLLEKPQNPRLLPKNVLKYIVEFLPPHEDQMDVLEDLQEDMELIQNSNRTDRATGGPIHDPPIGREEERELAHRKSRQKDEDNATKQYQDYKSKIYSAPALYETYNWFWDDDKSIFPKPPPPPGGFEGGGGGAAPMEVA